MFYMTAEYEQKILRSIFVICKNIEIISSYSICRGVSKPKTIYIYMSVPAKFNERGLKEKSW